MNYFPGRRCDPELAAPANRRALTTDDLTQMVDDAAEYAGQASASAAHAEEVVAGVDAAIVVVDTAVAQAETYAQSAQEAQEGASLSAGEAGTQATNAGLSAASAAGSATEAGLAAASVAKGQPNGTAPLDASAKLPESNVPDRLTMQALNATFVAVRTSDNKTLPPGTIVVITIDKTLAQVTSNPVADIADITFTTGA